MTSETRESDMPTNLYMIGVIVAILSVGVALALLSLRLANKSDRKADKLDQKIDDLTKEHYLLARQFSELRGQIFGRFGIFPATEITPNLESPPDSSLREGK